MLYGCCGVGFCMMMASILLSFGKKNTSSAAVAFFFIYMLIFGGSINCVPWVYVSGISSPSPFARQESDQRQQSAFANQSRDRALKSFLSKLAREAPPSAYRHIGLGTSSSS